MEWSATRRDVRPARCPQVDGAVGQRALARRSRPALSSVGQHGWGLPWVAWRGSRPRNDETHRRAGRHASYPAGSRPASDFPPFHRPHRIARACGNNSPSIHAPRCHGLPPATVDRNSAGAASVATQAAVPPNGIKFAARWEIRRGSASAVPVPARQPDPGRAARHPGAPNRAQREAENALRYRLLTACARSWTAMA